MPEPRQDRVRHAARLEKHILRDWVHRETTKRIYDIKRRLITVKRSPPPEGR